MPTHPGRRKLKVVAASPLPPLYAPWIEDALGGPIPSETEATCADCAMCAPEGAEPSGVDFDPRIKCCTYLPELPNFLVGRILEDSDPAAKAGRETVERRIDERIAITPLGVGVPAPYSLLYRRASEHDGFGRTPSLRCPHYLEEQGGACGIWKNRMSVCATWFCKHVRGAVGRSFWRTAILPLLTCVEAALSRWCVLELDPGTEALSRLFQKRSVHEKGELEVGSELVHDPRLYRRDWGRWLGKERELYVQASRLVEGLSWPDVLRIGGVELRGRSELARAAYKVLTTARLPRILKPGAFHVGELGTETARVATYCRYDPLEIPTELLPLLGRFDGRPTRQVLAEIEANHGVTLDVDLVQKLVDFEILVKP